MPKSGIILSRTITTEDKMNKIGLISTPHSMQNKNRPNLALELDRVLGRSGIHAVVDTFEGMVDALRHFMFEGVEVVAVNGGDGTLSHVVTNSLDIYGAKRLPAITPLRGGNLNVVADNLDMHGRPVQLLERLVASLGSGQAHKRNFYSLRVNGQVGFLFTAGTCSRFLEEFYDNKGNPIKSLMLILRLAVARHLNPSFFHRVVHTDPMDIFMGDERVYSDEPVTVFCSTVPRMPLGPKMFPLVGPNHASFTCLTYDCEAQDTFIRGVCDSYLRPRNSPWRTSLEATSLKFKMPQGTSYALDGEVFHAPEGEVEVSLGPRFSFLAV